MIGYISRDKNGLLCLYHKKPELDRELGGWFGEDFFVVSDTDFPELSDITYEGGPVKVEFNIKKV